MPDEEYIKGRGAQINPKNPYESQQYIKEFAEGIDDWEKAPLKTAYKNEVCKSVLNRVEAFDVPLDWSVNPYQGCEHGCVYCYARPSHEHHGYSSGTDFETNILVKHNAPEILRAHFEKKSWTPAAISFSGNTDPYQPAERKYKITRALLEICLEYRNPVGIITKNALILRDLDLLQEMKKLNLVYVFTTITGTDEALRLKLEPRTSTYADRFRTLEMLNKFDIPTGVMCAPIIPGINDHELPRVLQRAAECGARWAGYNIVVLNGSVTLLFTDWLLKNFPDKADKVMNHIKECHQGEMGSKEIGKRHVGTGKMAEVIAQQFQLYCKKYQLSSEEIPLETRHFRRKGDHQANLFSDLEG